MAEKKKTPDTGPMPIVSIPVATSKLDLATVLGMVFALGLIIGAIVMGSSNANFFNVPALMIVLLGTLAATAISYTPEELKRSGSIVRYSLYIRDWKTSQIAKTLVSLSSIAKQKGVLSLTAYNKNFAQIPFMNHAFQMVIDGFKPEDIAFLLEQELDAETDRHLRSASMARRAAEVAPAMGLIGTLVGLVQMLADLENPETIGPAMAVALLTTFYGAILGTVVMSSLAIKLDKRSNEEVLIKRMIKIAAISIASQENPRKLEMLLNSELPPMSRIRYFD